VEHKRAKRVKRRITCELVIDGKRQSGIVLDVSATGIFVQTAVSSAVGQDVEVHLAATRTTPELTLRARVARGRRVPPQLLAAAAGGLGLRVIDPPPGFAQLIVADDEAAPAPGRSSPPVTKPPQSPKPDVVKRRFQVRLQATGSTRSRSVTVQCSDPKTAGAEACAVVGRGWSVVDVSELP
jgi:PilZ domain